VSMRQMREAAAAGAAVLSGAVARGELPAAAFAVGHVDEGIVLTEVTGLADTARGRFALPDTPFCLASTTKPITTTVLGALVDLGVIGLDDPITDHVPEFPSGLVSWRPPTVREIAAHTAGLGTHHRFFYVDERPPIPVIDAVRTLARPCLPVGDQWRYSNLGYGVLQVALERAGALPMTELVDRFVFGPLEMQDSNWGGLHGPDRAAVRYLAGDEPYAGYVTDHPPASEAWCSIADLVKFGVAHAGSSLLRPDTHATLSAPTAPRQSDGAAYALGWVTRDYHGVRILVHGGRMGGVGAHLTVVPALGLVVAGLANVETERLSEAVAVVLDAVVPGYAAPVPQPPWAVGRAHPLLAARWEGVAQLGDDAVPVQLDATGERITIAVGDRTVDLVSPHLQPDGVMGHANLTLPQPLAPRDTLCHLDAVPLTDHGGRLQRSSGDVAPDVIVGALVAAQYPNERRRRQGDAVSAVLHLVRSS
jgi:CubicO group peptidase (beta-lactamase class C family)